jgi:Asp-tRNA(Asn)/Glu-tRNA(Gln) amidotransferase A subunit family amidase
MGSSTENSAYGDTRNPWDLGRVPGGSSGGSAAAVADFMVPLAFGTQTAGSHIRPASYCGIAACKPTYNLLPRAGVHPNADSLDTVGVYGRSVEDVAFFLSALTNRSDLEGTVERPRIGACRTWEWDLVEPPLVQPAAPDSLLRVTAVRTCGRRGTLS